MDRILIIGAHYDDAELGAGGTAAKLSAEGKAVYKLTLTNNEVAESAFNRATRHTDSVQDSARACAILGVEEISFPQEPVCQLRYSTEIMQRVEQVILSDKDAALPTLAEFLAQYGPLPAEGAP